MNFIPLIGKAKQLGIRTTRGVIKRGTSITQKYLEFIHDEIK